MDGGEREIEKRPLPDADSENAKFLIRVPHASVLPNIYNEFLLAEFAATSSIPDLTSSELTQIQELNFSAAQRKSY